MDLMVIRRAIAPRQLMAMQIQPTLFEKTGEAQSRDHKLQEFRKQVKAEYQMMTRLLQPLLISEWKWEHITMDFFTALPRS